MVVRWSSHTSLEHLSSLSNTKLHGIFQTSLHRSSATCLTFQKIQHMMYLLWTLLNFGLVLFLIVICFKATRLIRERLGLFASIIFVIGLLSFVNSSNNKNPARKAGRQTPDFVFKTADQIKPNTSIYTSQAIKTYIGSSINLGVLFGKEVLTGKLVAAEADFSISGLVGGHKWTPQIIAVTPSPSSGNFNYQVSGILNWNLLGIPVFSQYKKLEGVISVR